MSTALLLALGWAVGDLITLTFLFIFRKRVRVLVNRVLDNCASRIANAVVAAQKAEAEEEEDDQDCCGGCN